MPKRHKEINLLLSIQRIKSVPYSTLLVLVFGARVYRRNVIHYINDVPGLVHIL